MTAADTGLPTQQISHTWWTTCMLRNYPRPLAIPPPLQTEAQNQPVTQFLYLLKFNSVLVTIWQVQTSRDEIDTWVKSQETLYETMVWIMQGQLAWKWEGIVYKGSVLTVNVCTSEEQKRLKEYGGEGGHSEELYWRMTMQYTHGWHSTSVNFFCITKSST